MYNSKSVSVVLPAYNEEQNIHKAVIAFRAIKEIDRIYVIDNNSKDRTAPFAKEAGATVIQETRQGYGWALRRGLAEAETDLVILCEPDGTFVAEDVCKLLSYERDFLMVMGTRTTRELIWGEANMGFWLRVGNALVAKGLSVLFNGPSLSDCGCTFRLIHRPLLQELNPRLTVGGSHFLPELVILSLLLKAPIIEIPLNYRGRIGESKITGRLKGAVKTAAGMVLLILSYYLKTLFGFGRRLRASSRLLPSPARTR